MLVPYEEWKKVYLSDIREKLIESKREYDEYKTTKRVVYLQQAGNKLFSVVENYLMIKYKRRTNNYQELRGLISQNSFDRLLLSKVAQLHYFFYENTLRGELEEFEDIYLDVYKTMKNRMNI